jgi:hypothetical protein
LTGKKVLGLQILPLALLEMLLDNLLSYLLELSLEHGCIATSRTYYLFSSEKTIEQSSCNNVLLHCTFTIHKLVYRGSRTKKKEKKEIKEVVPVMFFKYKV